MALTDQPYLPLYVDDWMNNNKLKMCSAGAHGLMISIMCIMHKEEAYGKILLKQKYKQNTEQILNFACQLAKLCAFDFADIENHLRELLEEKVLVIEGDFLVSRRMVKDASISELRKLSGGKGGKISSSKILSKDQTFAPAKVEANTVNENGIENVNEDIIDNTAKDKGKEKDLVLEKAKEYYQEFILQKTKAKAKWDGTQVEALKSIIRYLKTLDKVSNDDELLNSWRYILKRWPLLEPYQSKRIKLTEINSDIIKIIDQIKNNPRNNGTTIKKTLASTIKIDPNATFGEL